MERLKFPPANGLPDDYRVRTQAALSLGGTNADGAIAPLCDSLQADPNETVRSTSAAALGRLKRPSSVDCLRARLSSERADSVRVQIQKAIDAIGAAVVSGAKYYVALAPITNNTDRSRDDGQRVIHEAIKAKLGEVGGYQMAPPNESAAAAGAAVTKYNLKGWYLSVVVERFEYTGAGLRVKLRMSVSTYPGKDIKGSLDNAGTNPGAQPGDVGGQDALLTALARALAQQLSQESKFR